MKLFNFVRPLVSAVIESLYRPYVAFMERTGAILYAAHPGVASHTDAIYSISANLPATYDAAGYGNVAVVFTVIDRVQDFPPYGSKREVAVFAPIRGAKEKVKGSADYGEGDLVMADMPLDPGQIILRAAEASQNHYSVKVLYPDGEAHYLDAIVTAWSLSPGKEAGFMLRTATMSFNKYVAVAAP